MLSLSKEGCILAGEEIAIYCWSDLGNRQKVLASCGVFLKD